MLENFGFPAEKREIDEYQRIPGFFRGPKCFKTYSYTSKTGTRQLNSHPCVSDSLTESKSPTFTTTLNIVSQNLKQIKLHDRESGIKKLILQFIKLKYRNKFDLQLNFAAVLQIPPGWDTPSQQCRISRNLKMRPHLSREMWM
jgi:hypothetical protein